MSRKFLITIVLILFLLPFISWYYLRSGLNWRKKAQEAMNGTQPFPEMEYVHPTGRKFSTGILQDHVSIVSFKPCSEEQEQRSVLEALYEQFKETDKANFIILDSCGMSNRSMPMESRKKWYELSCADSLMRCPLLKADWPLGKVFALVDRNGIIRNYYAIQTQEEKKALLEHMALLLPRERQEKVELRRGDKK